MKRNSRRNRSRKARPSSLVDLSRTSGISKTITARDWLRGDPLLLSITSSTVVFSGTPYVSFDNTSVLGTSSTTRVNTYQDWRILEITAKVIPLQPAYAGSTAFGFSENPSDAGSSTFAVQGRCLVLPNNNNNSMPRTLHWRARNFDDLAFKSTSSSISPVPVIFTAYTNNTDFGTASAVANSMVFRVEFDLLCEFRGLKG